MADKNKMRVLAFLLSAGLIAGSIPAGTPALAAAPQGSTEAAAEDASSEGQDKVPEENSTEKTTEGESGETSSLDTADEKNDTSVKNEDSTGKGNDTAKKEDSTIQDSPSNDSSAPAGEGTGTEEGNPEETAPGSVRFTIKGSGEELGKDDVSFDKDSTGYEDGGFQFGDSSAGDKIKYTVKKDGYKETSGEFTLRDSDQSIEVVLEEEKKDESVELSATYGDEPIDLSKELESAGYGSANSYSVGSGEGVLSVSDKGMAEIKKAGSASVRAETDDGTITFKVTVAKLSLGELSSDDIDWEGTEREEDGTKAFSLTGTVKSSAGLINGDSVTVTASGSAKSEKPGVWGTSLSNVKFQGAENYTLSLSGDGPEVTITTKEEEISISGAYGGSPANGKYFKDQRTLTVKATGDDFKENDLTFHLSIDGDKKDYAVSKLASGSVKSVSLEKDGDRTYILKFGKEKEEHEYAASITYGGKTAKITGAAKDSFVVDMAAPELTVTFKDKGGKAVTPKEGTTVGSYVKDTVTAALSVKDGSFDKKNVKATVKAADAEGEALSVYNGENGPSTGNWQATGKDHTFTMDEFTEDANYVFSVSVEDLAGNKAEYTPHAFGIDKDAPEAELVVDAGDEKKYTEYSKDASVGIAGRKDIRFTATAKDKASGVDKVQYYVETPGTIEDGKAPAVSAEKLPSLAWKDMPKDGAKLPAGSMSVIYLKVTDKAGNTVYLNTKDIIIADASGPRIKIEEKGNAKRAYNGDIELKVSAQDIISEDTYSGLSEVKVEVESGGEVTDTYKYTPGTFPDRVREFSKDITVDAKKNNSNSVIVRAKAKDAAGNEADTEKEFTIDTKTPEVEAEFTGGGIKNGHYLNETAELEVTFNERNFDPANAMFSFTTDGKEHTYTMEELSEGKGRAAQILVKNKEDSQADVPYKDRTDSRKVKYTLQLGIDAGADITYGAMRFSCTDPAGNTGKGRPELSAITIDKIAPVITASYSAGGADVTGRIGTSEGAPFYTQEDVTARFTVKDTNFAPGTVKASVTSKDSSGDETGAYNLGDISEGWSENGGSFMKQLPVFTKDANYSISVEAEDLAGNKASAYPDHYFTIDKTSPTGKITVHSDDGDKSYTGFSGSAVFDSVSGRTITVSRSVSDKTSGIANVMYYRYTPSVGASGRFSGLSLEALRRASWEDWDGELKIEPDSQAVIYARIADRAGNILYISTDGAMIADKTDPWNPDIKFFGAKGENGIYAADVPFTVSVSDKEAGGTYSGLKDVIIEILNGGTVTQRAEYHPGSKADRVMSMGATITIDASKNNSNNVIVRVTARDHAGNTASSEKQIAIDITDPVIEVTYDNNDPVNGKYYNKPRTATVTVKERNFDPSRVNLVLQDGAKASGWSIGSGAGSSDDARNTCTVTFGTDGDYAFTLSVKDKAGNSASYGKTDVFTVDMTDPVIRVTYNADRESGFYNMARTATIHVMEHNFRPQEFEAQIKAALEGMGIPAPSVSGWGGSGDDHTATLTFARDGDYSFTLNYTDLASNKAKGYSQGTFTIDLTAPVLEITGIKDGSANRGKVTPVIRYTDRNHTDDLTLKLSGTRHGERDVAGAFKRLENGGEIIVNDFRYDITEDDVYILTARSVDKAGNVTEKTIHFSVNRFGSNFYLDDKTKEVLEPYYMQHAGSVIIYEVNVDKVTGRTFTIYRDGSAISVPEGAIRIEEQNDGNGWNKYCYIINKSVLEEEGLYEIVVNTTDAAGNKQENRTKDVPVTFIVDRTHPSAAITGIEDGETYYSTDRDMEVRAMDDRALAKVDVIVDGKVLESYNSKTLEEMNGVIPFKISESDNWKTISAIAYDAAGNASKESPVRILVTTKKAAQLLHGPAPIIFGCLLAGLIALAAFMAKKLADRDEDEEEDEDDKYYK